MAERWEVIGTHGGDYVVVEVASRRVVPSLYSIELAAWLRASQNNLPGLRLLPSYHTEADIRQRLEAWLMERFNYRELEEFGPYWGPGYEELRMYCLRVRYQDAVDPKFNEEARAKVQAALAEFAEWKAEVKHA